MNQTLEILSKRRSVRAYSKQPLSETEKNIILNGAFRAPTAGNMMLYAIVDIEDQKLKDTLAVICDHQPFIATSPYVLLFLADYQRWFDVYTVYQVEKRCQELDRPFRKPAEGDMLMACCDALIAAQNAVIAAEAVGIGSCYIGDILENIEILRELLKLPRYVLPIALLCFGHPASEKTTRSLTRRFEPEFILHKDTYHRFEEDALRRMMQPLDERFSPAANGAENFAQDTYFRKFIADFSFELNRSAREWIHHWSQGD